MESVVSARSRSFNCSKKDKLERFRRLTLNDFQEEEETAIVTPSPSRALRLFEFEEERRFEVKSERRSSSLFGSDSCSVGSSSSEDSFLRQLIHCPSDECIRPCQVEVKVEVDIVEEGTEVRLISQTMSRADKSCQKLKRSSSVPPPTTPNCDMYSPFKDAACGVAQMISGEEEKTPQKQPVASNESPYPQGCCCKFFVDSSAMMTNQTSMEYSIGSLLGTKGYWFDGWQAWSLYFDEDGNKLSYPASATKPEHLRHVLQNRACDMNARIQRIRRLREDMAPFSSIRLQSSLESVELRKSCSFHHDLESRRTVTPTTEVSEMSIEKIFESVKNCGDTTIATMNQETTSDLCYDSDPGDQDFTCTSRRSLNFSLTPDDASTHIQPLAGSFSKRRHSSTIYNDVTQPQIITQLMNTRMTLIWHPTAATNSYKTPSSPLAVCAWIELGQQLRKTIIQPKFMWRLSNQKEMSSINLHGIDLLDIARIFELNKVNRVLYPFARKQNSLSIETLEHSYIFEASSESEKNQIVYAMKLIVARLGSKIIVNDSSVFDEFFSCQNAGVPGKEPDWMD